MCTRISFMYFYRKKCIALMNTYLDHPSGHTVCWSVCKLVCGLGVILKIHICMYHTFSTSNTCFSFQLSFQVISKYSSANLAGSFVERNSQLILILLSKDHFPMCANPLLFDRKLSLTKEFIKMVKVNISYTILRSLQKSNKDQFILSICMFIQTK